jgi:Bacterial TSP3 repeat
MKAFLKQLNWPTLISCLALLLAPNEGLAFPPAPDHILYGLVRDEWGTPLNIVGAEVFIDAAGAAAVRTRVSANLDPGMNYQLSVPMDSGIKPDLYKSGALTTAGEFRLKVKIGQTSYVPIEMMGNLSQIGRPGQSTRLDLTLGVDSDGDGIPDAWEQAIMAMYGGTLADITPDGDADGDGISNRNEFLAGTLPFDPADGFRLTLAELNDGNTTLEFMAVSGRTYTIEASMDLRVWNRVGFRVVTDGAAGPVQNNYQASEVRNIRVEIPLQPGTESYRYFKATVQ